MLKVLRSPVPRNPIRGTFSSFTSPRFQVVRFYAKVRSDTFNLRPTGPDNARETSVRLSPIDVTAQVYSANALFFKLPNGADQDSITTKLKQALEQTAGQCRHIAGTIEKDQEGEYSMVTRPDSTIRLDVKSHASAPSYDELEGACFSSGTLGDPTLYTIPGMTMSSNADVTASPPIMAFQLNYIPGGAILVVQKHHWAMDISGTTGVMHQLAANCVSIEEGTATPTWDPKLVDRSRFIPPPVAEADKTDAVQSLGPHPQWQQCAWLMFHIPRSKCAELKQLASPKDGSWISTYDAVIAMLWRTLMRHRTRIYEVEDYQTPAFLAQSCNMRSRLDPPVHKHFQGNIITGGIVEDKYTLADVVSDVPLSSLAAAIRRTTNSMTAAKVQAAIDRNAPVRNKSEHHFQVNSLPPSTLVVTDWRDMDMCDADYGFLQRPGALRTISDRVTENMIVVYPRRSVESDPDHGMEVVVPFEVSAVKQLIDDSELRRFATFIGFEAGLSQTKASSQDSSAGRQGQALHSMAGSN